MGNTILGILIFGALFLLAVLIEDDDVDRHVH